MANDRGSRWTARHVRRILRNEKYIGNNVWNRESFKLQKARVRNRPELWLRADGAFEPIIERSLFDAARTIIDGRALYTPRGRRRALPTMRCWMCCGESGRNAAAFRD
jgi:hypothetical protein